MNCPRCGAFSAVLETRAGPLGTTRRRRECANLHRFVTFEVLPQVLTAAGVNAEKTHRAIKARNATWRRNAKIVKDPRPTAVIAAEHGITEAMVRYVRKNHA